MSTLSMQEESQPIPLTPQRVPRTEPPSLRRAHLTSSRAVVILGEEYERNFLKPAEKLIDSIEKLKEKIYIINDQSVMSNFARAIGRLQKELDDIKPLVLGGRRKTKRRATKRA